MIAKLHRLALRMAHALRHRWRVLRRTPLEGVTVIACDLQGKVLLVRHSYGPRGWFLPGGGIGRGERPEQAAVRELREETGCVAEGTRLVGSFEEQVSGSPHTAHIVTCLTDDDPQPDRREVIEARFFPTHSLPEPLSPRTAARLAFWRDPANAAVGHRSLD
ncbi:DNA mismatch repair protein MutT [Erythrobacter sp. QSSC1-22B]|uniref:NUDIX domain-containing protein n=1 Tax=Erythrobacter sp. QSSC1-22B TaxID=1860125 RepID=UPI00080598DE|nr:NUDIX domain-containing protein [Erythrobacter sp. QSSC1-22B]OBX19196.1 DNA mismatch repair protein MutT [Erythrobacter sp. QSSC1-22B]